MRLVSWNVNGLRAVMNKGFSNILEKMDADVVCLQEIKMQREQANFQFPGYHEYWNSAERKGYSGTLTLTKQEPISVSYGMGIEEHDKEGRVITIELQDFYVVNCYTPNSRRELERLEYREKWEDDFREYLIKLNQMKPVILCGDLNVAHQEIDLKNPKTNRHNAGFTDEERNKMTLLLNDHFTDTFRYLYPEQENAYTWWSYMEHARSRNIGWRIDYFIVSDTLQQRIIDSKIHADIMGSDHCPVELEIK